jgi:threonine dehydrogenase-like Zn-dependent dehydrogenase
VCGAHWCYLTWRAQRSTGAEELEQGRHGPVRGRVCNLERSEHDGVSHDVELPGGPAPVRRFLPDLIQLIWDRTIDPGKVFDLTLPLEEAAQGYKAMDERRATKVLLTF